MIPHTYTTRHSTGLLAHRNTILTQPQNQTCPFAHPDRHAKSYPLPCTHTSLPRHSHTCTHHRVVWSTHRLIYIHNSHGQTHILTDCTRTLLHMSTHSQAQMPPNHGLGPLPSTPNASTEKSTLYLKAPPLPTLTMGSSGSQIFPSSSSSPARRDLPPVTHPSLNVQPHLHTQKPASRPHCPPPGQALG